MKQPLALWWVPAFALVTACTALTGCAKPTLWLGPEVDGVRWSRYAAECTSLACQPYEISKTPTTREAWQFMSLYVFEYGPYPGDVEVLGGRNQCEQVRAAWRAWYGAPGEVDRTRPCRGPVWLRYIEVWFQRDGKWDKMGVADN